MQHEVAVANVRILVDVIDPRRVEQAGPALYAMHHIPLGEQKFRQVRAVLAGDASDESGFLLRVAHFRIKSGS